MSRRASAARSGPGRRGRGEARRTSGLVAAQVATFLAILAVLALLPAGPLSPRDAAAHPLSPSLLRIDERGDGTADVLWKTPSMRVRGARLEPELPASCRPLGPRVASEAPGSLSFRWRVACGRGGLSHLRVGVRGLETSLTDALVHVRLADGREIRAVLRPGDAFVRLAARRASRPLAAFFALGLRALFEWPAASLVVLALPLLAATRARRARVLVAYALGQGLTVSLAALRLVEPPAGLEVAAALALYGVAIELARERRSWLGRRAELGALALGLVHGLGFGRTLAGAVMAATPLALSLAAFQAGLLAGLAAVVAAAALLLGLLGVAERRLPGGLRRTVAYPLGGLAAYWLLRSVGRAFV